MWRRSARHHATTTNCGVLLWLYWGFTQVQKAQDTAAPNNSKITGHSPELAEEGTHVTSSQCLPLPLSLSTQHRAILAAPRGTLCALNAGLLVIHRPGQPAPGGEGGTVPPPSVFRVGGGGFGARNEAQKGRIRAAFFARAD